MECIVWSPPAADWGLGFRIWGLVFYRKGRRVRKEKVTRAAGIPSGDFTDNAQIAQMKKKIREISVKSDPSV